MGNQLLSIMTPVSQGRQRLETKALEAREGVLRNVEGI